MQPHPMPEFGSFSLLLALVLAVYTLVVGAVALWRSKETAQLAADGFDTSSRLGETARRAGIGTFVAMSCAAFALVWASFTNDYSVSYILHHTNRSLNSAYKFSALLVRPGRFTRPLGMVAGHLRLRSPRSPSRRRSPVCLCIDDPGRRTGLLSLVAELCRTTLRHPARPQAG